MTRYLTTLGLLALVSMSHVKADDHAALSELFDSEVLSDNVRHLRDKANRLSIEESFDFLQSQVVRNDQLQLHIDFVPDSRAPVSPLLDLIVAAEELQRLDSLEQQIRSLPRPTLQQQKACAAALSLIASRQKFDGKNAPRQDANGTGQVCRTGNYSASRDQVISRIRGSFVFAAKTFSSCS